MYVSKHHSTHLRQGKEVNFHLRSQKCTIFKIFCLGAPQQAIFIRNKIGLKPVIFSCPINILLGLSNELMSLLHDICVDRRKPGIEIWVCYWYLKATLPPS